MQKNRRAFFITGEKGGSRMTKHISLLVNDIPIELDYFVQEFIEHTMGGMMLTLKGTGEIKSLDVVIQGDEVIIDLNNARVPVNPFVAKIIRSTVTGMVSSLKGVSEINKISLSIRR